MRADNCVAFVILHYQNIEVTQKCVSHLLRLNDIENHNIVIVDNSSPNKSGVELNHIYENVKNIYVLMTDKNGGFAYGNNYGYRFAKEKLKSDIIVVMNSDVYIEQSDFITISRDIFSNDRTVDIIAPCIYALTDTYQNPLSYHGISYKEAKNIFKEDPYKLELIEEFKNDGLTVYTQGEFTDLCRGGHVSSTKMIKHFKLLSLAGAYWRGNSDNKMLVRIYGT
ncbi:MAG: glycosyltransferase, partial [Erysipelotrichia bacterium]|nr:glycosyltransferase [Erysipelotrichia bacterium]